MFFTCFCYYFGSQEKIHSRSFSFARLLQLLFCPSQSCEVQQSAESMGSFFFSFGTFWYFCVPYSSGDGVFVVCKCPELSPFLQRGQVAGLISVQCFSTTSTAVNKFFPFKLAALYFMSAVVPVRFPCTPHRLRRTHIKVGHLTTSLYFSFPCVHSGGPM